MSRKSRKATAIISLALELLAVAVGSAGIGIELATRADIGLTIITATGPITATGSILWVKHVLGRTRVNNG